MVIRNNFHGSIFHGEVSEVWERDPLKADDVIRTLHVTSTWFCDVDGVLHASVRMATISTLVLPYVATWAFYSAANERYWPQLFIHVSARLVTEDRWQGPYQWGTGSEREPFSSRFLQLVCVVLISLECSVLYSACDRS